MATLARAIAGLASQVRPTGRRLGTVQAIDTTTGTLTVRMGGDDVQGIPWQASSYSPVVGDRVSILWDRNAGMLVTGTLSTVRVSDAEQVTVELSPHLECQLYRRDGQSQWYWDRGRDRTPYGYDLNQGYGFDGFTQTMIRYGTYVEYPPVSSAIPSGASGAQISVRIMRTSMDWSGGTELPLVSPVLYGHATPLPTSGGSGPDPYFATEGWRAGALTFGDEAIYPLPSAWQEGLLTGSLTGLATFSEKSKDFANLFHTETVRNEDGTTTERGTPGGNAHLIVTYTPPAE